MIKKIPIKGISRDPSGQISSDGFCAESLNVQLDMGEVAPAVSPKSVNDASGNPISLDGDIIFIHKGVGYENLLYRSGVVISYVATEGDPSTGTVFGNLSIGETVNDITAVGNTVIISTSEDMYYCLWKDEAYHFLGSRIPVPDIHFRMGGLEARRMDASIPAGATRDDFDIVDTFDWHVEFQDGAYVNAPDLKHDSVGDRTEFGSEGSKYILDSALYGGFWTEYLNFVWSLIDRGVRSQSESGKAVYPVFVRYAIRLYDGTMYSQSIPVLLGADIRKFFASECIYDMSGLHTYENIAVHITNMMMFTEGYSIFMDAGNVRNLYEGWEDIVTGVDVFVSPQITPIQRNAAHIVTEFVSANESNRTFNLELDIDPYYANLHQEQLIRYYQTTYLAKSFTLQEFLATSRDEKLDINFTSDYIMAQRALVESPQSMHHVKGDRLFVYNKALLLSGAEQVLSHGYPFLHSVRWAGNDGYPSETYRFVYYIRGENGENVVFSRDETGGPAIEPKSASIVDGSSAVYHELPCAWLAYPDSRCYRIDIYVTAGGDVRRRSFQTQVFDQADVAYVFTKFGDSLTRPHPSERASLPSGEKATSPMPSSLVVSKVNNPFVFPVEDKVTFTAGEILNMAVATRALSEGQFGQFPLYVFTDEGVFALSVNEQGKFLTNHPVSRDILLSRDSLVGIEQGVFFAAKRGLLLLQGSQVTKVSSEMEGKPVELDDESLLPFPVERAFPLGRFLDGCFLVYDYANTRIIIFNETLRTAYVYKFDTQSWHRLRIGDGWPVRSLNSYPEAQVVFATGGRQTVLDLSVLEETDGAEALQGLVYSRDLDLDSADIYKSVRRLKVRGRFADQHVKWQLQGSNDGRNYTTIHSLRGPSWKWYRFVLVTNLEPGERISYVEFDYEPRFTDKIR